MPTPAERGKVLVPSGFTVQHHTCDVCGISSLEVPLFSLGDGWLCGPVRCLAPGGA